MNHCGGARMRRGKSRGAEWGMSWIVVGAFLSAMVGLVQPAQAETPAPSNASLRLAFVDMQSAILKTEEGKKAKARIEKEAQTKRDELISQQEALNKMGQEFQAQQAVLSEASRMEKQREIQMKLQGLRNSQLMFEQEVRRKEMEETQKIIENLQTIIDEVAQSKGFDLVFERGAGALLYAATINDITDDVVKIYNERHQSTNLSQKDAGGAGQKK